MTGRSDIRSGFFSLFVKTKLIIRFAIKINTALVAVIFDLRDSLARRTSKLPFVFYKGPIFRLKIINGNRIWGRRIQNIC